MGYKREHIRIPIAAVATLSCLQNERIKARAVNICAGGLGITGINTDPAPTQYHVQLETRCGEQIELLARVAHRNDHVTGLKTIIIDKRNLNYINDLVTHFQSSEAFIEHIDNQDNLSDWFTDVHVQEVDTDFEKSN